MEKLRRSLKIFWTEHRDPILFYTIVIVAVILVVQGLNALAIQNNKKNQNKNDNRNSTGITETISVEQNNANKELINKFIEYCEDKKIEDAYALLSENCKIDLYPTIDDFIGKYYNQRFNKNYDIEIKHYSNSIYEIIFYESMLEVGSIENRNSVTDYYKIETEVVEDKIYINYNKEI